MNVCILTHTFPKHPEDPTAAFMHPLVMGIRKAGSHVTVLSPYHIDLQLHRFPYPVKTYKYIWPDRFHVLGYSQTLKQGTHFRISSWLLAPFLLFWGTTALLELTKREKFDVVSTHWIVPNGIIAAIVCGIRKIPFTVSLPGSDVYVAQKNALFSAVTRWAAERAAMVFADSPAYLRELKKTGAFVKRKEIISYPVDVSIIKPVKNTVVLRKKLGIARDSRIIVSVGRLIEKKGFQYGIRALPGIVKKFPKTRYIIVGDGDMHRALEKEAAEAGVKDSVHFVGNVSRHDLSEYYSIADVILVPSIKDSEGNIDDRPVALLEAMMCGRAVVASRLPGNAATVEHGISGILVSPKEPAALTEAVVKIFGSQELQRGLGREARRQVLERFRHTMIGKQYHNFFVKIITQKA